MRFVLVFGLIFITSLIFNTKVSAISSELNSSTLKVDIGEPSKVTYNLNYSAYTAKQVIEKISYKFPFKDIANLTVTSNGKNLAYEFLDDGDLKVVTLILSNAGQEFQLNPKVELSFNTNTLLKTYPKGQYFYLPPFVSDYTFQTINFNVNFEKLNYIPSEVYTNSFGIDGLNITGSTDGGILAFWEEMRSFNVIFPAIKPATESQLLINLPIEESYKIYYIQNPAFDFGLVDKFENRYGVANPQSDLTTSFFAEKLEEDNKLEFIANDFPQVDFSTIPELNTVNDLAEFDKLKAINNYVVSKLSPILIEETDLNLLKDLQNRIDGNSKLTSFEYCYYLSSLATSAAIKSKIVYGYNFFNSTENLVAPHIWCEFYIDSKTVIADPWAEDVYKVHMLGTNNVDRFKYGQWNQDSQDNNLLGITDFNSDNIVVEIKNGSFQTESEIPEFIVEIPASLKSGELNNFKISFSKKYTFEEINSLNINGYAINFSTEKYKLAFAPNSLNILKLKVDPGTFLFFTPGYFLSTNLVTTNGNFSAQGNANILPNTNFTVFLICIALGTFVSLLASYKYRQMMIAGIRGLAIRVKSKYTRRA